MGEFQETQKKVIQILSLFALILPSILETQRIGSRGVFLLGGALQLLFIEHPFWALLTYKYNGPISTSDPIYVFMPYFTSSLITIFVWFVGCLSPIVVYMVFSRKMGLRRGLVALVILSFVPFFPGIPEYIVGDSITYIRTPLIIPQITSFITLAFNFRKQQQVQAQ